MIDPIGAVNTNCAHMSLTTGFQLTRVGELGQAFIDLKITCADCGEPYLFTISLPPSPAIRLSVAPASAVKAAQSRIVVAPAPALEKIAKNGG